MPHSNSLIKQIIEGFCSRYTPGGEVLYLGDAFQKHGVHERERLAHLGIIQDEHSKMPDVIVYLERRNWLVLIEVVTNHGPIDLKRHNELKALFSLSRVPLVFVSAFATYRTMRRYFQDIAWETDVWVAESPSHLIHFNGERYLGPYEYGDERVKPRQSASKQPAQSGHVPKARRHTPRV